MRLLLVVSACLIFTASAAAQGTRACFTDENQMPANQARVEVFENGLLIGTQDLGESNCTELGIIIANEVLEQPSSMTGIRSFPTVGRSSYTVQVSIDRATEGTISIYSVTGRLLTRSSKYGLATGGHKFNIDLGYVTAGTYFIVLESSQWTGATQIFSLGHSAGSPTIRYAGQSSERPTAPEVNARKSGGFAYDLRVTRYGSRQSTFRINRGQDLTVELAKGRTLFIDARLATNHSMHLRDTYPGTVRIEDIRSGLKHEVAYNGEASGIYLLSDSTRVNYISDGIQTGMQVLRDNPDGTPRRTMAASFSHEIPGPLFLPPDQYDLVESHAFLFAVPESFDYDQYADERLNTFFVPVDPVEAWSHENFDFTDDTYRPEGSDDPNQIRWDYTFPDPDGPTHRFSAADEDLVRELMTDNAPDLFANTLYDVEFVEVAPPEGSSDYIIKLHQNDARTDGAYSESYSGPILYDLSVSMPILAQWTPAMFLNSLANASWGGKDINEPIDKVNLDTGEYTVAAREIMAVNYAYGPIKAGAWDEPTLSYYYAIDTETGTPQGVFLSHEWAHSEGSPYVGVSSRRQGERVPASQVGAAW